MLPLARMKTMVYALGGIVPEKIPEIRQMAFDGVAVMGAIWRHDSVADRVKEYLKLAYHGS